MQNLKELAPIQNTKSAPPELTTSISNSSNGGVWNLFGNSLTLTKSNGFELVGVDVLFFCVDEAFFFGGGTTSNFGQLRAEIWSVPSPPGMRPADIGCCFTEASTTSVMKG